MRWRAGRIGVGPSERDVPAVSMSSDISDSIITSSSNILTLESESQLKNKKTKSATTSTAAAGIESSPEIASLASLPLTSSCSALSLDSEEEEEKEKKKETGVRTGISGRRKSSSTSKTKTTALRLLLSRRRSASEGKGALSAGGSSTPPFPPSPPSSSSSSSPAVSSSPDSTSPPTPENHRLLLLCHGDQEADVYDSETGAAGEGGERVGVLVHHQQNCVSPESRSRGRDLLLRHHHSLHQESVVQCQCSLSEVSAPRPVLTCQSQESRTGGKGSISSGIRNIGRKMTIQLSNGFKLQKLASSGSASMPNVTSAWIRTSGSKSFSAGSSVMLSGGSEVRVSRSAQSHAFKKLKTPAKCKECDSYLYFYGLECHECGLTIHKKCLSELVIFCPHKRLQKRATFGSHLWTQAQPNCDSIPSIVSKCVSEIDARGRRIKGLYRVSGVKSRVEKLCSCFDHGADLVDLSEVHPNIIANVLKLYLRQLPEPLMTHRLYPEFIHVAKQFPAPSNSPAMGLSHTPTHHPHSLSLHHHQQPQPQQHHDAKSGTETASSSSFTSIELQEIHQLVNLVSRLPKVNYLTLAFLMHHLKRVSDKSAENSMTSSNLGIVFGPTLMTSTDVGDKNPGAQSALTSLVDTVHHTRVIDLLITYAHQVFGSPLKVDATGRILGFADPRDLDDLSDSDDSDDNDDDDEDDSRDQEDEDDNDRRQELIHQFLSKSPLSPPPMFPVSLSHNNQLQLQQQQSLQQQESRIRRSGKSMDLLPIPNQGSITPAVAAVAVVSPVSSDRAQCLWDDPDSQNDKQKTDSRRYIQHNSNQNISNSKKVLSNNTRHRRSVITLSGQKVVVSQDPLSSGSESELLMRALSPVNKSVSTSAVPSLFYYDGTTDDNHHHEAQQRQRQESNHSPESRGSSGGSSGYVTGCYVNPPVLPVARNRSTTQAAKAVVTAANATSLATTTQRPSSNVRLNDRPVTPSSSSSLTSSGSSPTSSSIGMHSSTSLSSSLSSSSSSTTTAKTTTKTIPSSSHSVPVSQSRIGCESSDHNQHLTPHHLTSAASTGRLTSFSSSSECPEQPAVPLLHRHQNNQKQEEKHETQNSTSDSNGFTSISQNNSSPSCVRMHPTDQRPKAVNQDSHPNTGQQQAMHQNNNYTLTNMNTGTTTTATTGVRKSASTKESISELRRAFFCNQGSPHPEPMARQSIVTVARNEDDNGLTVDSSQDVISRSDETEGLMARLTAAGNQAKLRRTTSSSNHMASPVTGPQTLLTFPSKCIRIPTRVHWDTRDADDEAAAAAASAVLSRSSSRQSKHHHHHNGHHKAKQQQLNYGLMSDPPSPDREYGLSPDLFSPQPAVEQEVNPLDFHHHYDRYNNQKNRQSHHHSHHHNQQQQMKHPKHLLQRQTDQQFPNEMTTTMTMQGCYLPLMSDSLMTSGSLSRSKSANLPFSPDPEFMRRPRFV